MSLFNFNNRSVEIPLLLFYNQHTLMHESHKYKHILFVLGITSLPNHP